MFLHRHSTLQAYRRTQALRWLQRFEVERKRNAIKAYVNRYVASGRQLNPLPDDIA